MKQGGEVYFVGLNPERGMAKVEDCRLNLIVAGFLKKEIPAKNQLVSKRLQVTIEKYGELRFRQSANFRCCDAAIFKQHESWYATHTELLQ
jgi:hypothetical protein